MGTGLGRIAPRGDVGSTSVAAAAARMPSRERTGFGTGAPVGKPAGGRDGVGPALASSLTSTFSSSSVASPSGASPSTGGGFARRRMHGMSSSFVEPTGRHGRLACDIVGPPFGSELCAPGGENPHQITVGSKAFLSGGRSSPQTSQLRAGERRPACMRAFRRLHSLLRSSSVRQFAIAAHTAPPVPALAVAARARPGASRGGAWGSWAIPRVFTPPPPRRRRR